MKHPFCNECPLCRPAILDMKTGSPLPDTDPVMVIVNRIWDTDTTYKQREAFINVTRHNSRKHEDLTLCDQVMGKIMEALPEPGET